MMKEYVFSVAGKTEHIIAENIEAAEELLRAHGMGGYSLLDTIPLTDNRSQRLKDLIESYRRIYMSALLTDEAERVAYLEGFLDGLEMALKVVDYDNSGES